MKAIAIAVALLAFALPAQAETRAYQVSDFHAINADGQFRIEYVAGPRASVILTGNPDHIDRLRVSTNRGQLAIRHHCTFTCNRRLDVVARVTAPSLDRLQLAKGVAFDAEGLAAGDLSIDIAMGAVAELSGTCANLQVETAMGGVLDARNFECRSATIQASMGGVAHVSANQSVDASASMGGTIDVAGGPAQQRRRASMGGAISIQ